MRPLPTNRIGHHVALRVAFTLTSVEDGSSHTVEAYGEALDAGDKATTKAMSAAYKSAMVQTFCIPVCGSEDADRTCHRLSSRTHDAEPVQGWKQWCLDFEDIVALCESEQAISMLQERNRDLLKALAGEQAELYAQLGQAFTSRREVLSARTTVSKPSKRVRSTQRGKGAQPKEIEHA